ncbi:MAG: hypothetical protein WCG47_23040, partial [Dermatophilaceae bacterium]
AYLHEASRLMRQLAQGQAPPSGEMMPQDTELESGEILRSIIGLRAIHLTGRCPGARVRTERRGPSRVNWRTSE